MTQDKELQKKLITEVMHQDEDDGLYDTEASVDATVGKLYLERLMHEYEELKREVSELKKEIETVHEYYNRRRS